MNRLKTFALSVSAILLFLNNFSANAQSAMADSLLMKALASDELLPLLIDSAIKYSPELRRTAGNEAYASANLQITKKAILSAVSLGSSYNYGTNFSAVNNPSAGTVTNNFTTAQTGFYNVGIGIQLPITHVLNRKNIIKEGQSLLSVASAEKDNAILYIRQEVIRLYQDFKLSQKLVTISSKNKQAAEVNNSMAEKDFINGQLTVAQVSGVLDIYNKSIIEFETNLNRFQTSYMQLENYTGANLSTLIMHVK